MVGYLLNVPVHKELIRMCTYEVSLHLMAGHTLRNKLKHVYMIVQVLNQCYDKTVVNVSAASPSLLQ